MVDHAANDTPEMRAFGHVGYEKVAADREANRAKWTSVEVKAAIVRRQVERASVATIRKNRKIFDPSQGVLRPVGATGAITVLCGVDATVVGQQSGLIRHPANAWATSGGASGGCAVRAAPRYALRASGMRRSAEPGPPRPFCLIRSRPSHTRR